MGILIGYTTNLIWYLGVFQDGLYRQFITIYCSFILQCTKKLSSSSGRWALPNMFRDTHVCRIFSQKTYIFNLLHIDRHMMHFLNTCILEPAMFHLPYLYLRNLVRTHMYDLNANWKMALLPSPFASWLRLWLLVSSSCFLSEVNPNS